MEANNQTKNEQAINEFDFSSDDFFNELQQVNNSEHKLNEENLLKETKSLPEDVGDYYINEKAIEELDFSGEDFFDDLPSTTANKSDEAEHSVHPSLEQEIKEIQSLFEDNDQPVTEQKSTDEFEFTGEDFVSEIQQIHDSQEKIIEKNVSQEVDTLVTNFDENASTTRINTQKLEKKDNFGFNSLPKRADYDNTASFNFNLEVQEKMQSLLDGNILDSLSTIGQSDQTQQPENQNEQSLFIEPESLVIDSSDKNEAPQPQEKQASVFEENNEIEPVVVDQSAELNEVESSESSSVFLAEEEVLTKEESESEILLFDGEDEKTTNDDLLFELPNEELNAQEVIVDSSEKNDDIDDEFDFSLPDDTNAVLTETNNTSATINEEEALLFAEEVPKSQDADLLFTSDAEVLETNDSAIKNSDDLLFELPDEKQESNLFEETATEQSNAEQNLFEEKLDEQDNAEAGSLFEEDASVKSETPINDDLVLNHESTDSVQIDDIGIISSQKNQNKALARLIPYSPQRYFCLPTFATLEILEKPKVIKLPCTRNYVYGMIEWQNQHIPLIDIQRFIMNDNSPLQSDDVNFALVVVYVENQSKEVKHVAIALNKTPSSFMADDSMMTELPTDNPIWKKVAISCFEYQGSAVPIVNSNFLFGN